jgi:uncharacterized protein with FMN-binding domain
MSPMPWRGTVIFTGTLAAVAVVAVTKFSTATQVADGAATTNQSTGTGSTTSTGQQTGAPSSQTGTTVVITGDVIQTRYGPIQVAATFDGTTLTDVQALQHPRGQESDQINAYAIPILTQEAVASGSASISSVSGATFTSQGYRQSLQSAINQRG